MSEYSLMYTRRMARTEPPETAVRDPRSGGRGRAAALPPEERRAAIVAATRPLLRVHGTSVTTRQIAEAAGVAEGTIFRVFPDKESLIEAVVESFFDHTPTDDALREIDRSLPLEARLVAAVDVLRQRVTEFLQLRVAMETLHGANAWSTIAERYTPPDLGQLVALFEPDRDSLRLEPRRAAHLLRAFTVAGTHPSLLLEEPLEAEEIVTLFLNGARVRADGPSDSEDR